MELIHRHHAEFAVGHGEGEADIVLLHRATLDVPRGIARLLVVRLKDLPGR